MCVYLCVGTRESVCVCARAPERMCAIGVYVFVSCLCVGVSECECAGVCDDERQRGGGGGGQKEEKGEEREEKVKEI